MEKNTAIVRLTKTGLVKWRDTKTKNNQIAAQLIYEGYDLQMTPEELGKAKYLVVNSNPTSPKRISSGMRTEKQKERFMEENHDKNMEIMTKRSIEYRSVEYNAIRRILGPDADINWFKF